MIALLDTNDDLTLCEQQLGCEVGQLLVPKGHSLKDGRTFGIDNGCFGRFDEQRFMALMRNNEQHRDRCKFVSCPDVVADARRTLEVFDRWRRKLVGWPIALVAQDGLEDLEIPWELIDALFIGGSTEWKMSRAAEACVKSAKILGKWVHAGRVNTPGRFEYFEKLGADSIDGTGLSKYTWMRHDIWFAANHPTLFAAGEDREMVSMLSHGLVGAAPVLDQVRSDSEGTGTQAV